MQMFSRPFHELITRNKDGDYCSLNPKAARLILEEKLKMVMRLRNGEGGSRLYEWNLHWNCPDGRSLIVSSEERTGVQLNP